MSDRILIVDFGSQVTQLIARRVRESGVYSEIVPFHSSAAAIKDGDWKGIILSGGPASVLADDTPRAPAEVFDSGLPVLGICYGHQTMVAQLGGGVEASGDREFGRAFLEVSDACPLFAEAWEPGGRHQVWMSHGDSVTSLPDGFRVVGISEGAPFAAIADERRGYYGVQFHPEVAHTPDGAALLRNFTHRVARCSGDWTMAAFRDHAIAAIRAKVGENGRVLCGVSGGVDSSVVAVLLHEAVGDRVTCILVDNGVLRAEEADAVVDLFRGSYNIPLVVSDSADLFLSRLVGVTDPEQKRKVIGYTFIEVFEAEAKKNGGEFLAQGTLYPDVIESVSFSGGPSATIKSHHNVGGLPEKMNLILIEPLRELFKDEVRALGRELGLPETFVGRHPFPGPGLAIRIPGEVTQEKIEILRRADALYLEEIRAAGLYDEIWQAFAVLLPVRTVGVMGDERSYEFVCALRAVTSTDGMTADAYPFTPEFLGRAANRIVNSVRGINRVVYDVTSKPPGTIEWE
jgi:GMP synthase (glutamine-hydrolysing)